MIFLGTVMDEETNTNNSVRNIMMIMAGSVVPGLHVDVNIYHDHMRLLAFYNDQCPVVNSTGVL